MKRDFEAALKGKECSSSQGAPFYKTKNYICPPISFGIPYLPVLSHFSVEKDGAAVAACAVSAGLACGDSGAMVCVWKDRAAIHGFTGTNAILTLADRKTRVKPGGCGVIVTRSNVKIPVLYVKDWPRNYLSSRVLWELGC